MIFNGYKASRTVSGIGRCSVSIISPPSFLPNLISSFPVSGQAPGVGDGQGRLECCSPRSHKESETTERLN